MNQFKRAKVIMLPTENKKSNIILGLRNHRLYNRINKYNDNLGNDGSVKFQEVYIISDDEIKEGDYVYDSYKNSVYLASKVVIHNMKSLEYEIYLKKIIATTDTLLKDSNLDIFAFSNDERNQLPQPSQQFIEKYIESYNKNEVITNVLVEYDSYNKNMLPETGENINIMEYYPKVNPKDNTITIKKLKDSWTNEEMYSNMQQYMEYCKWKEYITPYKWIKENL